MRWVSLCLATVAVLAVACDGGEAGPGERSVVGVSLDVQASSISEVDSLTLRTNDGETLVFGVAPDAARGLQEGLFPSHLRSHAAFAERVEVFYREENGELLAMRLAHR